MPSPWRNGDGRRGSTRLEQRIRLQVLNRDRWVCQLCRLPIDPSIQHPHPMSAQVHHLVSAPGYDPRYLVAAHRACNIEAGEPERADPEPRSATRWEGPEILGRPATPASAPLSNLSPLQGGRQ